MTETDHGSDVQGLETEARYEARSGQFVLTTPHPGARKDYIGNAACHGRLAVVFAQLVLDGESRGVHAFVVPIRGADGRPLPGVEIEDCGAKVGLNGVDNGRLRFEGVRLPREALLDRFARVEADGSYTSPVASPTKRFFTMLGTLVGGRISVALAALSATKSALSIAVRYAARRRQFGPDGGAETVLLDYLTHQRRLLPALATGYALHFALHGLARRYAAAPPGEDGDRREIEILAAGLKAFATWHATATIQECREACGGQGYLAENRLGALKADSDVFTTFEGDNTVLMQLVAKGLLSSFRHHLGELSPLGLVRMVARRAGQAVAGKNPAVTRRTDPAHLRSPELQGAAFRAREEDLVLSLARRLKARIDRGLDPFHALVECQDHALAAARAYVERVAFEAFRDALEAVEDPDLARVLTLVEDLYALERLDRDRAWFLEHGLFEPAKAEAVRAEVNRLCAELRPHALALVAAFAIPEPALAAPIAL
jgi:acyl-CoA oxidase